MRFLRNLIRNQTFPNNAGPGQPRLVIGPDLPPPLNTYTFNVPLGPTNLKAVAALIGYAGVLGDATYNFIALLASSIPFVSAYYAIGSVVNGSVLEIAIPASGAGKASGIFVGNDVNNSLINIQADAILIGEIITGAFGVQIQDRLVSINPQGNAITTLGKNDFDIDQRSQGRGLIARATSAVNIACTAGTNRILGSPLATYRNGRAFMGHLNAVWNASTAGLVATLTAVNGVGTGVSGTTRTPALPLAATQCSFDFWFPFRNNSGGDQSTGMQLQVVPSASTVNLAGSAAYPATLDFFDVGAASDYPDYPSF